MKIFLGGEGPDELGSWYNEQPYRTNESGLTTDGILTSLLKKIQPTGWEIVGAIPWSKIRKYQAKRGLHDAEIRNVMGLIIHALDAGAEVVVFSRDRDKDTTRGEAIEEGIAKSRVEFPEVGIVGGVAIEEIEAWVLAVRGERRTEQLSRAKEALEQKGITSREQKMQEIERCELENIASDAESLRVWIERARSVLCSLE